VEVENGLQVKQGSNAMLDACQFGLGASLVKRLRNGQFENASLGSRKDV